MPDTAILTLICAVIGTLVLLSIGLAAGFWAGVQAGARGDSEPSEELMALKAEHAECLAQLAALNSGLRAGHEQSEVVGLLAQSSRPPLSSELSAAIGQMLDTMRALEQKVRGLEDQELRHCPRPVERCEEPGWKRPAAASAQPPEQEMRVVDDDEAPDPMLTTQEMSDLMGGRHHLGESTFEMECRRYPYDCAQQLAPWAGPLPAKEDYVTVQCHSISVSGISLLWHEPPKFSRAIVSLGTNSAIYMLIEVPAYKAVYMHGSVCYLVQCQFVSRLERLTEDRASPEMAECC